MSRLNYIIFLALLALVSLLFWFDPKLDIATSGLFYQHHQFLSPTWFGVARHILSIGVWVVGVGALLVMLYGLLKRNKQLSLSGLFIILCFALGPGLLVNAVLKNHWGRPRPHQIAAFNGAEHFQKPWVISQQCSTNCSFVAGDSSTALAFLALAFLPLARRKKIIIGTLALLNFGLFGFIRVAQGGHFLSDVLIGGVLTYLVISLCYSVTLARHVNMQRLSHR